MKRNRSRSRNYEDSHRSHRSKYDSKYYDNKYKDDYKSSRRNDNRSKYDGYRDSDRDDSYDRRYDKNRKDFKSYKNDDYKTENHDDRNRHKESRKYENFRESPRSEGSKDGRNLRETNIKHDKDRQREKYNSKAKNETVRHDEKRKSNDDKNDKEKIKEKEKKLKKKTKKSDKDKKKRKRQKNSSDEDLFVSKNKINDSKEQSNDRVHAIKDKDYDKIKSNLNIFTKSEAISDDEFMTKEITKTDIKKEKSITRSMKHSSHKLDRDSDKHKRRKTPSKEYSSSRHRDSESQRSAFKHEEKIRCSRDRTRSRSRKSDYHHRSHDRKDKNRFNHRERRSSYRSNDDKFNSRKSAGDDGFDEERFELARIPSNAQFAGLFSRLNEEIVSDTEIEDILPPVLLDDQMKALIENDANVSQELWDSEDDVLIHKKEIYTGPKHKNVLETLSVPWNALLEGMSTNNTNSIRLKQNSMYSIPHVLKIIGISARYADMELQKRLEKEANIVMVNPIAALQNSFLMFKNRRKHILTERESYGDALSARKDFVIRNFLFNPII